MRKWAILIILAGLLIAGAGFAWKFHGKKAGANGIASYYADRFNGRKTANGEIFDITQLTAAHRTLPFGTHVRVTNLKNGKSVVVRINDRGPYVDGRVIDLSPAAARKIDLIQTGVTQVTLEVLKQPSVAIGN